MLRPSLAAAAALLVLGPAVGASAQSITTGLSVEADGEDIGNPAKLNRPTSSDCDDNVKWEFAITYNRQIPVIEAWVGKQGTDCSQTSNRSLSTATQTRTTCWRIAKQTSKNKVTLSANTRDIFRTPSSTSENGTGDDDAIEEADKVCDENAGTTTYTVFILPLSQETLPRASQVVAPLTDVGATLTNVRATFYPFTVRPDAPTNLKARSGENSLGVSFSTDSSNQNVATRFRAYVDYGAFLDGGVATDSGLGCGSGLLEQLQEDGGRILPPKGAGLEISGEATGSPILIENLDELGIPIGAEVAISTVTIDPAKNSSLPSAPICVKREETVSGLDACNADPECKAGLTTCSLDPGSASDDLAGLSITGLALAFALRRRRKAACAH
jgi:MYXO-CTERM domain-containing protein